MPAPDGDGEGDADDEVTTLEEVEDGGAGRASSAATTAQAAAAAPAAAMGSSGLSSIYEAQREATRTVMVMEYCPDGDLATWLAAHHPTAAPTPPTYYETHFVTALQLLYDVVSGMFHLHERKVLHGDLKPQNILLTRSPRGRLVAKIADFGIARPTVRTPDQTQTRTYINVDGRGTPLYMAPEMTRPGRCTRLADVYSFAIVLHDCLVTHDPSHKFPRMPNQPPPEPPQIIRLVRDWNLRPMVDQEGVASDGYDPLSPWPDTPEPYKARFRTMMADCWQKEDRGRPLFEELDGRFEAIFRDNRLPLPW
jgi:serine/threonine protein kinase